MNRFIKWTIGVGFLSLLCISVKAQEKIKKNRLDIIKVNSPYDELAPVVSGDGSKLFFVRGGHPENLGYKNFPMDQDIWVSEKDARTGEWGQAYNLKYPVNNEEHNVVCGVSQNADTLFVSFNRKHPRKEIYVAYPAFCIRDQNSKDSLSYGTPQAILIEDFEELVADKITKDSHFHFSLSYDFEELYLSYKVASTKSEPSNWEDIYVCERLSGAKDELNYGAPQRIKEVNSLGYDTAPFLSWDKQTLFLSSNREEPGHPEEKHPYGHIYVASRLSNDIGENTWGTATENPSGRIGVILDTIRDDADKFEGYFYPLYNPQTGQIDRVYYSAFHEEENRADIYEVRLDRLYNLIVEVRDSAKKELIPARVDVRKKNSNYQSTNERDLSKKFQLGYGNYGEFLVSAEAQDERYKKMEEDSLVLVKAEDYVQPNKLIVYLSIPPQPGQKDTSVTPEPFLDEAVVLEGVNFDFDRYYIRANEQEKLDLLVKFLEENKALMVSLGGYCDCIGSVSYNVKLSINRVNSVKNYLVNKGIASDRIVANHYDEQVQIGKCEEEKFLARQESQESRQNRAKSRRVVIEEIGENLVADSSVEKNQKEIRFIYKRADKRNYGTEPKDK